MSRKNDLVKRCFHDGNPGRSSRLISKRRVSTVLGACLAVLVGMLLLACPSPGEEGSTEEPKVTGITLSTTDANFIKLDKTLTLSVEVTGTGDYDKSLTWSSSSDTIAVVENGTVTGKSAGTVTITAKSVADTSVSDSIELEVKANYVDTVTIDGGNLELNVATKRTLSATVTVEGTLSDVEKTITWSSDQPNIASIDASSGELEAKAEGTAQIRATAGGVSSMPISVKVLFVESFIFSISYNNKEYRASKILDVNANENSNIVNIFIDEDYDAGKPLNLSVSATIPAGHTINPDITTARNYSDQTPDIFEVSDGTSTGKFRLHIFRKPILVDTKPAGNIEKDEYETSGATAVFIRKFVQTDYYYVPAVIEGKPSNLPAPTFALFGKDAKPTKETILSSPVRILRNFSTDDGNTLFFSSVDDGIEDDDWDVKHHSERTSPRLNPAADLRFSLSPSTDYSLHWAVEASNGKFSGSLRTVSTAALPTSSPTTGTGAIKYFGVGGMKIHPVEGLDFRVPALLIYDTATTFSSLLIYSYSSEGKRIVTSGVSEVPAGLNVFVNANNPVGGIYSACYGTVARHDVALQSFVGGIKTAYNFDTTMPKIIEIE